VNRLLSLCDWRAITGYVVDDTSDGTLVMPVAVNALMNTAARADLRKMRSTSPIRSSTSGMAHALTKSPALGYGTDEAANYAGIMSRP